MLLRSACVAALWTGCVPTPSTTKTGDTATPTAETGTPGTSATGDTGTPGTSPTGDTGAATPNACPPAIAMLPLELCLETTATPPVSTSTSPYVPIEASGSGTITEVGGVLGPVAGSVPFDRLDACTADHPQQVRLVDGAGDTWTFGWGLPTSPLDAGSADAFAAGDDLDFSVTLVWGYYGSSAAVVLSDQGGPRFLWEHGFALTEAERGGVAVELHNGDTCLTQTPSWGETEHYLVTFTGSAGGTDLRSGQQGTVSTPARDLDFTLLGSYWYLDCADACGATEWTAWETP